MSNKLLLIIVFLFTAQYLYAQSGPFKKPDYKYIQQVTGDPSKPVYYSRLFTRYINDDTTLSPQEFHLLYFGYFFQPGYGKINPTGYKDSVRAMSKKSYLSAAERRKMVSFAKRDLGFSPFDLTDLNWLCSLYYGLDDVENYALYRYKLNRVTEAILATGDGRTENSGLHVLSVGDEFGVLSSLDLEYESHQTNSERKYDYLKVAANSKGISGVYFDVSQILETSVAAPEK